MRSMSYLVVMLSAIGWASSPVWGEDTTKPPETPGVTATGSDTDTDAGEDSGPTDPAKTTEKAGQLATKFGVTQQQVLDMRQTSHMGWGEIRNLLLIAQAVSLNSANTTTPLTMDQAFQQVLTQRSGGMGLGQIANSHNLKLGDLVKADAAGEQAKGHKPDSLDKPDRGHKPDVGSRWDKPDRPSKPDHPVKPDRPMKPDKPDKPDTPGRWR